MRLPWGPKDPNLPAPDALSADEVQARFERATLCPTCGTLPGLHRRDDNGQFTRCPLTRATLHGRRGYARLVREPESEPEYQPLAPLTWLEQMAERWSAYECGPALDDFRAS